MSSKDSAQLAALAVRAIETLKGQDIVRLDVRKLTDVTDYLVIATGKVNGEEFIHSVIFL